MTKKNFWLTALVIAIIVIIDQVSKALIEVNLSESDKITLIPNFFYISLVYNKGAAWGSLSDNTLVLMLISIAASLAGLYFCVKNDFKTKKFYSFALSFIVAGAFGNLYDRLYTVVGAQKGVIDFLEFHFGSYHFPVFNIADSALVIGVILLLVDIIFFEEKRRNA